MKAVGSASVAREVRSSSRREWRERAARLYAEFEAGSRAMVRRAFRGAFGEDELDDIYSNAWLGTLRALEHRHEQLTDEEIRSYVFAAVAHQASRELRRRRRKPTAPLDAAMARPDAGPGPDERAASDEHSRVTRDLLASLPPRRRSVMLLRYGWGLDPKQVCGLVKGLSPRAYRKEITRGVEELAEKMRAFERGEWCDDREPILRAYAAGIADPEQARQAEAHLSHCRECHGFVARLTGHLHDLGGAALGPAAIAALAGEGSLSERVAELADRARDGVLGVVGRSPTSGSEDGLAAIASSGGVRGAGAAGAGVFAKLAAFGAAGKVATACIGGGLAASACIAAGVGPVDLGKEEPKRELGHVQLADEEDGNRPFIPAPEDLPGQLGSGPVEKAQPVRAGVAGQAATTPKEADAPPATVVATETPAQAQEFGVEAAAAPSQSPQAAAVGSTGGGGGSASAARQEFAP